MESQFRGLSCGLKILGFECWIHSSSAQCSVGSSFGLGLNLNGILMPTSGLDCLNLNNPAQPNARRSAGCAHFRGDLGT